MTVNNDVRLLLQSLPRCIFDSRRGIKQRCPRVGVAVLEEANGERDYGAPLCIEHVEVFARSEGKRWRRLRYAAVAERLSDQLGVPLATNDVQAPGVELDTCRGVRGGVPDNEDVIDPEDPKWKTTQ